MLGKDIGIPSNDQHVEGHRGKGTWSAAGVDVKGGATLVIGGSRCKGGRNIATDQALEHVYGYAVGLDMTRRDLQRAMGDEKKPWEIGKSFDRSAVLGPIHPAAKTGHFAKGAISLAVNGNMKQNSNLQNMIWSVAEQIAKLSEAFELKAGDIIYSGTPENVGPVAKGDVLLCKLEGLPDMSIKIV